VFMMEKQTGRKTLTLTDYVTFTLAIVIMWGGCRVERAKKESGSYIVVSTSLGVYRFPDIITSNSTYFVVRASNGPSITTFHGTWTVGLYPLQMTTNKESW